MSDPNMSWPDIMSDQLFKVIMHTESAVPDEAVLQGEVLGQKSYIECCL